MFVHWAMDFSLPEWTQQIAQSTKDFARTHILPHVMEWDEAQTFPKELFSEMGKLGLMGVTIPEAYGGAGLTYVDYVTVIQEVASVCGSIGLSLAAHNSLCTGHMNLFGSEEQKRKYVPL